MEVWTQVAVPLIVALLTSTALWGVVSKVILKRMELTAKRSKADEAQRKMLVTSIFQPICKEVNKWQS